MAHILQVDGIVPAFGKRNYLAPSATITGKVKTGDECSIWFSAVIRGDVNDITLGNRVNVQDNATIHCTYKKTKTVIGNNVTIGHNAVVHGCTIHDNVLVGMGAIIMDNAVIGSNTIIAAGAVVLEGTIVEEESVYAGIPAKRIKSISPEMVSGEIDRIASAYVKYASWYGDQFTIT